jgi:hypothetical protein
VNSDTMKFMCYYVIDSSKVITLAMFYANVDEILSLIIAFQL